MMNGALSGLRVIELAQVIAAPMTAQLLALEGADVLKVEPPEGDWVRRQGALIAGASSTFFEAFNRGKTFIRANLRARGDREAIRNLVAAADVFITNQDPGYLAACGLDRATMFARNPTLVYAELSGFGPGGPQGTDALAQAASGMTSITGPPDGQGFRSGVTVVDVASGVWLAFAILTAVEERRRTGRGKLLQISLHGVALSLSMAQLGYASVEPSRVKRIGNHSLTTCTPVFTAADGRVFVTLMDDRHWSRFATVMGQPELIADPRFAGEDERRDRQADIEAIFSQAFATDTRAAWIERLRAERIPCTAERTVAEVLADPALYAAGALYRQTVEGVEFTQVGSPVRRSDPP